MRNTLTKKIKSSRRGLTFSLDNNDKIGTHYRYVIDLKKNEILIIEDSEGSGTVSRKKSGVGYKALYDIRSKEVRNIVSSADYMEVEETADSIIVHVYKKAKTLQKVFSRDIVRIEDILCQKTGEIRLSKAVGCEGQYSFDTFAGFDEYIGSWHLHDTVHGQPLENVYRVMSLFSGAGMLDYAFARKPQYRFVYANDACILDGKYSPEVAETYRHNIGCNLTIKDIRDVQPEEIPDCDVAVGGPCCQAYSNANRINQETEVGEMRRHLVDDYVRLVKAKNPKVFVIENVKGILTKKDGKILNHALEQLSGYEITATVVKDDEVGGYTIRERAIIIGSRIGKITLPDLKILPVRTVRDALSRIDDTWETYHETQSSESVKLTMSYVPQGGNWRDVPESVRKFGPSTQSNTYHRLAWDKPAKTITNWRKCCLTHPDENRIITINEASALMGLDGKFKFFGGSGAIQQMVGNGVTQAIAGFVEKHVTKQLQAWSEAPAYGV